MRAYIEEDSNDPDWSVQLISEYAETGDWKYAVVLKEIRWH